MVHVRHDQLGGVQPAQIVEREPLGVSPALAHAVPSEHRRADRAACIRSGLVGVRPPSGTVTFLFTDIEGSTRRWEADPDAMRAALALHDEVLRSAIEAHGGWLFKHTGDGVCAAFGSARAAIDAAVAAQLALGLPVRMGIATGEAERRGDDYFGPVLNRTARVMAAGHGGQILVAASTAAWWRALSWSISASTACATSRGSSSCTRCGPRPAGDFPRFRTVDAAQGNLPVQATSFVGRDAAVKDADRTGAGPRLVTLTGVGGVGQDPPGPAGRRRAGRRVPRRGVAGGARSVGDPRRCPTPWPPSWASPRTPGGR